MLFRSGLISFRTDWFDLLAVQGTLKNLFQHHSSKASILWCKAFFMVQLSHPYMTTRKSIQAFVSTVMSLLNMLSRFVVAFIEISRACSVVSDSLQSHGLYPTRLFCPWNSLQEYWSVLPFPTPEGLPIPETEPMSPAPRSKQLLTSWLCSARSPNPQSEKKTLQDNATCNRGIYY